MKRAFMHARIRVCLIAVVAATCALLTPSFGALAAPADPHITAQYAVVLDADTGQVLFNKEMDTPTAPASLTKIFTAAVALSSASLDQKLTVDSYDLVGQSSMGLSAGQTVTLRTALYGMLLPSGNDAAMAVAQNLGALPGDTPQRSIDRFMERVNSTDARLGLTNTHLVTPHGLDTPGHQSTARDIAAMTLFALRSADFRKIIGTSYYHAEGFELYQSNSLLTHYPGLIGGKTGITDNAGYCLVEVAQRDGHTVIAVVMKSTQAAWFNDATALLDYGFSSIAAGAETGELPKISLAPAPPAAAPAVTATAQAPSNLTIHQVSESQAVVHHSAVPVLGQLSWRWPLAAGLTMLIAMGIVFGYSLIFAAAGLLWHHRPRVRLALSRPGLPKRRAHRAVRRHYRLPEEMAASPVAAATAARPSWDSGFRPLLISEDRPGRREVAPAPAHAAVSRAFCLAEIGDYRGATEAFKTALRTDSMLDLTRCPGFWGMQPAGYLAAARAYAQLDRLPDARTLLTVVKIGCDSDRELAGLLHKVVASA